MAIYYEIIDEIDLRDNPIKQLRVYKENAIGIVAPTLDNYDYRNFLQWNAQQPEPLVLPEGWPIL